MADGKLPESVVTDIANGKASIHGVAQTLKAKPAPKPKASGWRSIVSGFVAAVRKLVRRDPQRRSEVAAELRRMADEVEQTANVAA